MIFKQAPEFEKELKALGKRWPSLPKDLKIAEQFIETLYVDQDFVNRAAYRKNYFNNKRATILSYSEKCETVKMRLDCASLGKKDSVHLVFVFIYSAEQILFIELFSKTDKEREDTVRMRKYLPE